MDLSSGGTLQESGPSLGEEPVEAPPADPLQEAAAEYFGVHYIFPYQRLVVSNVLEGRSQIVVLPTGAGKSFCFLLPAALLQGLTIVVYPLRSLIADQARRLSRGSIRADSLTGETPRELRKAIYERCRSGKTRILLTNPEMLIQQKVKDALRTCDIAHLVIDEAHVLPEWGESFRPAYVEFARISDELGARIKSAFTATASPSILRRIEAGLFSHTPPHHVLGIPDRPNIHYSVRPVLSVRHELKRIAQTEPRPILIFCRSRATAQITAATLRADSGEQSIRFYHAGLEPTEKTNTERWFFSGTNTILASTCAYGMGVDKENVRTVVHPEVPESVEAYLQETGRAGRDGKPARAIALVPLHLRRDHSAQTIEEKRKAIMLAYLLSTRTCRREYLLSQLTSQKVDCSGCDVCDGTARREPPDFDRVVQFFRRNAHRYEAEEAVEHLRKRLQRTNTTAWTTVEAEELLASLRWRGIVGPPKHRFGRMLFGNRLVLRRRS